MPELKDVIDDVPPELLADDTADGADDGGADTTTDSDELPTEDGAATDDTDVTTDDDDAPAAGADDGDDDDYITDNDDDDDQPVTPSKPVTNQAPPATDENAYILNGLTKITVRIVGADDKIQSVQAYGWNDLPQDMKGFATPYEQGVFTQAVQAQEIKARELQQEYRNKQVQADTEAYVKRENRAIADDLTDLRREGVFPKFKGVPGTKEFNESAGAKEFDRVVAYMNKQNDEYARRAREEGKAYRHIGFREAYVMLNGPNPKAAEKAEDKARKGVAAKLTTSRGTKSTDRTVSNKRVDNITDLQSEFNQFVGQGGGSDQ